MQPLKTATTAPITLTATGSTAQAKSTAKNSNPKHKKRRSVGGYFLQSLKRIPLGTIFGEIPLEACKAYPTRIWVGTGLEPRIAYADYNTHQELNILSVKLLPDGGKTAPHPQIVFFVNGSYHVENLGYMKSDPLAWTTWIELHLDARQLKHVIDAVIKAEIALEGLKT